MPISKIGSKIEKYSLKLGKTWSGNGKTRGELKIMVSASKIGLEIEKYSLKLGKTGPGNGEKV